MHTRGVWGERGSKQAKEQGLRESACVGCVGGKSLAGIIRAYTCVAEGGGDVRAGGRSVHVLLLGCQTLLRVTGATTTG